MTILFMSSTSGCSCEQLRCKLCEHCILMSHQVFACCVLGQHVLRHVCIQRNASMLMSTWHQTLRCRSRYTPLTEVVPLLCIMHCLLPMAHKPVRTGLQFLRFARTANPKGLSGAKPNCPVWFSLVWFGSSNWSK